MTSVLFSSGCVFHSVLFTERVFSVALGVVCVCFHDLRAHDGPASFARLITYMHIYGQKENAIQRETHTHTETGTDDAVNSKLSSV